VEFKIVARKRQGVEVAVEPPVGRRCTVTALLMLTVVAGIVDAVSYLGIGHVFIALTTGNIIFLGLSLDPQAHVAPLASAEAICAFLAGVLIGGRAAAHLCHRTRLWLGVTLVAEACIIGCVAVLTALGVVPLHGTPSFAAIAMLGVALGLQTATIRHFGVRDLLTTVLTMAMTGVIADSPIAGGRNPRVHRRLGSIVCMMAGAAVGAVLIRFSAAIPLGIAAALTAAAAAVFVTCPAGNGQPRESIAAQPNPANAAHR
jgi:uncharacterized membrane protein YoaK (UPF0700 family)